MYTAYITLYLEIYSTLLKLRARLLHLARSGNQSLCRILFILPAHGASHAINYHIASLLASHATDTLQPAAINGNGDRKFWDPRAPMIWDKFSIFRTNCAILTSYVRAQIHAHVGGARVDVVTFPDH